MKKIFAALGLFTIIFASAQNVSKVEVQNPAMDVLASIPKDKIELYNQAFSKFVSALKTADKQAVGLLISDKVKSMVDENMIQKLSGGISFERKTEVYQSGYQKLLDGQTYPAIQYKYADDKNDPPRDSITVIFENDGKILGVKPNYSK
ncbi:peptidylprolyl isomerase [Chryseobacterium sp. LC2016-29]|uniref:peptidylprolyl isomerase n=1 Tax=Chryseobacterium sp. LC2016-29 TaxID=2897331 RepID=UPI001E28D361|nr:peptidylprolyl isomerase [Chryseobacterium sp. LC2016-29]MCD0478816.1 peptidylprolyl isomerase [Chryseobacterium sp. LC2016-29]